MLTLKSFAGDQDLPSVSNFCLKAMALLNLSGQPWQLKYVVTTAKTPYSKLPVLRTPEGMVPDSAFIQAYLEKQGAEFHHGLTDRDKAMSYGVMRIAEDSLRLGLMYDRWVDDRVWPGFRESIFAPVPLPLRGLIANRVKKQVVGLLNAMEIERYTDAHRRQRFAADLAAISSVLGDKPFLFGDHPTAADTSVQPVLDMLSHLPAKTDLNLMVTGSEQLMSYIARARAELFPKDSPVFQPA